MDINFENSDIKLTQSGEYSYVRGVDEAVQTVKNAVSMPKGRFIYEKDLGFDMSKLDPKSVTFIKEMIMLLNEVLARMTDIDVEIAGYNEETRTLELDVYRDGEKRETEVSVDADL